MGPARGKQGSSLVDEGKWLELGVFGSDDKVRAEPFEAVELALEQWWPSGQEKPPSS